MSQQTKEEILESGVVHFSLGDEFGIRLMEIAQEHVLYSLDPEKGLAVLTESLIGCPDDLALQILKGDMVCFVEDQEIMVSERTDENDSIFPKLDIKNWYIRKAKQMLESGDGLQSVLRLRTMNMTTKTLRYDKKLDYTEIINFVYNGKTNMFDDIYDLEEVDELMTLVKVTKDYIEQSLKINSVIDWLRKTYPSEFVDESKYVERYEHYRNAVDNVSKKLVELLTTDYSIAKRPVREFKELDNYLDAVVENDKIINEGIKPVDIMDNYSAGWLSPEGEYYALNGEIANMLHNQIADALQDNGLIPIYEAEEDERYFLKDAMAKANLPKVNPDVWLEQQGWVKIHGNNVHFAGCLNSKLGKTNVQMTDKQIQIIFDYIQNCHQSEIKLGWRMTRLSAGMFYSIAQDRLAMNKKYFSFD